MMRHGRVVEPIRVPPDLAQRLAAEAERRGVDPAILAGDLVAEQLAGALAEVAREVLARGRLRLAAEQAHRPAALPRGGPPT